MPHESPDTTGNYEVALAAAENGIAAIPILPGTKVPAVKWKRFQTELPSPEELRAWFVGETRYNIAVVTTGMVLFDVDDPAFLDLVLEECGDTPYKVRTPSGGTHVGYRRRAGVELRNQVKVKGRPIDIRTNGGLALIPPSRTEEGAYEWLGDGLRAIADLPLAKIGWTRQRTRRRAHRSLALPGGLPEGQGRIRHPEAYCLRILSIQGENGSRALVRVVCVLRDAGRTPQQVFDFLWNHWNPLCARPPWSEREILHAVGRHCGQ